MTRVIHGGLRYLENAEFRLVRESLRERNLLLRNAPTTSSRCPPPFRSSTGPRGSSRASGICWDGRPSGQSGRLLSRPGCCCTISRRPQLPAAAAPVPLPRAAWCCGPLNPEVICTATYYDARITYPERLCLELVQDAEAAVPGARAELRPASERRGRRRRPARRGLRRELRSETAPRRQRHGRLDRFHQSRSGARVPLHRRTKGSHIVLDHPELVQATGDEMIYFVNRDSRICISMRFRARSSPAPRISHRRSGGGLRRSRGGLHSRGHAAGLPFHPSGRSHVVFRFCGVRPLPRSDALTPGQISRDHSYPVLAQATESISPSTPGRR